MAVTYDEKKRLYGIKGKVKLINGKYRNYNRKPQWKRKKDAVQAEIELRNQLTNEYEGMTFDELVSLYNSKYKLLGVKEVTVKWQEHIYQNHIHERFGNININDITANDIEMWQMDIVNSGKYKEASIRGFLSTLKKYLNYAYKNDLIKTNPCDKVSSYREVDKVPEENDNFWELDEFNKFIKSVDDEAYNLLFTFLFFTGLIVGEARALTWKDFDGHSVTVNKSYSNLGKVTSPKTKNSYRTVDLPGTLSDRLKERYNAQKQYDGFSPDWFVFGDYRPFSKTSLGKKLNRYIDIAKVKRITLHGFRHSHASMLIKMRIDDSTIAKRLGHTVAMLRKTYAHVYSDDKRELIDKLDKLM